VEPGIRAIEGRVTPQMNHKLTEGVFVEEISLCLHHMAPLKAPGSDGFSACFYQQNWGTMQKEVCEAVLHFFETGYLDSKINATNIALIPKIGNPICGADFMPFSLYNVLYKLIFKILANRLKEVLPTIIYST
jgi:hypothetical protein